jgi:hypothetical protein
VTTLRALAALSPEEFLARMVAASHGNLRAQAGGGPAVPEVVGEVFEGDSLAHVVYRSPYVARGKALVPLVSAMSARRDAAGRWRLLPDFFVMGTLRPPQMLSREF